MAASSAAAEHAEARGFLISGEQTSRPIMHRLAYPRRPAGRRGWRSALALTLPTTEDTHTAAVNSVAHGREAGKGGASKVRGRAGGEEGEMEEGQSGSRKGRKQGSRRQVHVPWRLGYTPSPRTEQEEPSHHSRSS